MTWHLIRNREGIAYQSYLTDKALH